MISNLNFRVNKFRALSAIYTLLRELMVFLQILLFFPVARIFAGDHSLYYVLGILVFIAASRILWVTFEFKSAVFARVYAETKKEKVELLTSNFR